MAGVEGPAPTIAQMVDACEIGANVQLALSRDKVSKETARRLRWASSTLLAQDAAIKTPATPPPPKPKPEPAGEKLGAGRIGDLARAVDCVIVPTARTSSTPTT